MKAKLSGAVWFAAMLVSAPLYAGADGGGEGELAQLHSFDIEQGRVTFTVTSNGCTQEGDFSLHVDAASEPAMLQVIRHRKDPCRRMPFSKTFSLAAPELEQRRILMLNNIFIAPLDKARVKAK